MILKKKLFAAVPAKASHAMLLLPPAVLLAEVQHSSAPPQQFPGSRIVSKANWGALWDPPYHPDGYPPLPGSGKKKSLNGWAKKPEAQVWALCYSSFTDNHDNPDAFHKQCDKHSSTMLFLKNARNFTFGAYVRESSSRSLCDLFFSPHVSCLCLLAYVCSRNTGECVVGPRRLLRDLS